MRNNAKKKFLKKIQKKVQKCEKCETHFTPPWKCQPEVGNRSSREQVNTEARDTILGLGKLKTVCQKETPKMSFGYLQLEARGQCTHLVSPQNNCFQ